MVQSSAPRTERPSVPGICLVGINGVVRSSSSHLGRVQLVPFGWPSRQVLRRGGPSGNFARDLRKVFKASPRPAGAHHVANAFGLLVIFVEATATHSDLGLRSRLLDHDANCPVLV